MQIEQNAVIEAPLLTVMAALNDVESFPDWATVPGVIDNVKGQNVGMTYNWRYKVSELTFKGQSEIIEQTESRLVTQTTGDVESLWTVTLTSLAKRTAIRVVVEYALPHAFIEPLVDMVIQRITRPEVANKNMRRFKEAVEKQAASDNPQETKITVTKEI